jgi:hypothetical protein
MSANNLPVVFRRLARTFVICRTNGTQAAHLRGEEDRDRIPTSAMARVSGLFVCARSPEADTPALARRLLRIAFAYAAATAPTVACGGGSNKASDDGGADSAPSSCRPTTCAALGAECGVVSDGCGTILQCGFCVSPQVCGWFARNRCGCPSGDCDAGASADAGVTADTGSPTVEISVDAGMAFVRTIVLRNNDLVFDCITDIGGRARVREFLNYAGPWGATTRRRLGVVRPLGPFHDRRHETPHRDLQVRRRAAERGRFAQDAMA